MKPWPAMVVLMPKPQLKLAQRPMRTRKRKRILELKVLIESPAVPGLELAMPVARRTVY